MYVGILPQVGDLRKGRRVEEREKVQKEEERRTNNKKMKVDAAAAGKAFTCCGSF